ncbi:MAG TPA: NAD(P)(+) transhydrogenase (Re/Si-specific) subunit beta, partial [Alphaproteobacteria bacterium]|nr:NAD(P)(+) transhydrogenase (Re/Si-specific) subunit beta [Alphaproteobacteria bacterium]
MAEFSSLLYLVSSILFILSLRGLSHPETARQGLNFGMAGMGLAIATTLASPEVQSYGLIIAGIIIGGTIGSITAVKIQMTALPQLVAAFHSLVGLAAVCVAVAAFHNPEAYNIGSPGNIHMSSLIEMSLGVAIGAITFTGSIIAWGKLQGVISGKPLTFSGQHIINAILALSLIALIVMICISESTSLFWMIILFSLILGILLIVPIGGADMPVIVSMLNSYSGWAAAGIGFTLQNPLLIITGALVGASGAILSYIMCKGMNRSFLSVILGGFGAESGATTITNSSDKAAKIGSAEDAA